MAGLKEYMLELQDAVEKVGERLEAIETRLAALELAQKGRVPPEGGGVSTPDTVVTRGDTASGKGGTVVTRGDTALGRRSGGVRTPEGGTVVTPPAPDGPRTRRGRHPPREDHRNWCWKKCGRRATRVLGNRHWCKDCLSLAWSE